MNILLLILIPCVTAALIPLLDFFHVKFKRILIALSAVTELFLNLFILFNNYHLIREKQFVLIYKKVWSSPIFTLNLTLDSLGLLFSLLFSLALCLIIIYSIAFQENKPDRENQFFILLFLVLGMIQGTVLSGNILNIFIFFELITVVSAPLIAITNKQISTDAAVKYLIYGLSGGIIFLLGIIFIWFNLNTLNIAEIAGGFSSINFNIQITIIIFLLLGILIKLGIFPFHAWLPLAHSACPSSISALLSGVLLKVYLYIFLRIFWYMIDFSIIQAAGLHNYIIYLGLFSSLMGHFFALQADNIKRMLAFSSIGNIGIIVAVFALNTEIALYGGLLHIIGHLLMKSTLFTGTGYLLQFTPGHLLQNFRGVAHNNRGVFIGCIITMLSMIGLPPLIGFISKWYILLAFLQESNYVGIIVVILGSIISAIYYFRYIASGYRQRPAAEINTPSQAFCPTTGLYHKKTVITVIYIFTALVIITGFFYMFLDIPLAAALKILVDTEVHIKLISLGG